MKLLISFAIAAVLVLTGCSTTGNNQPIQKAVFQLAVSSGVSVGSARYPEAVPYARIANQIICSSATGTNVSPAEIVAAIQNSPAAEAAATPQGKLVVNGVLILYGALFEGGGIDNEDARQWLQWTCDAVSLGLPASTPNAIAERVMSPKPIMLPYLK